PCEPLTTTSAAGIFNMTSGSPVFPASIKFLFSDQSELGDSCQSMFTLVPSFIILNVSSSFQSEPVLASYEPAIRSVISSSTIGKPSSLKLSICPSFDVEFSFSPFDGVSFGSPFDDAPSFFPQP